MIEVTRQRSSQEVRRVFMRFPQLMWVPRQSLETGRCTPSRKQSLAALLMRALVLWPERLYHLEDALPSDPQ